MMPGQLRWFRKSLITGKANLSSIPFHSSIPRVPTLFLSECFASYLPAVSLERIISFVATRFSHVSFLAYEMANADDAFGQVMIRNLRQRGLEMGNVMSQIDMERLFQSFFGNCSVTAMRNVYQSMVDETEHERLNRIEMMDEWEEWNLILQHYCLIYAWK